MFLKIRANKFDKHIELTFFTGLGIEYTCQNCGSIVIDADQSDEMKKRIIYDVWEDVPHGT